MVTCPFVETLIGICLLFVILLLVGILPRLSPRINRNKCAQLDTRLRNTEAAWIAASPTRRDGVLRFLFDFPKWRVLMFPPLSRGREPILWEFGAL